MARVHSTPMPQPGMVLLQYDSTTVAQGVLSQAGFVVALAIIALVFCRLVEFLPDFITAIRPAMLLLGGGTAMAIVSGGVFTITRSRVSVLLLLFTVWAAVCIPVSVWPGGATRTFVSYCLLSLLAHFIIRSLVVTLDQCRKAMYTIAASMLIIMVLAFFYSTTERNLGRLGLETGSLTNPNILALLLLTGLPFCFMAISLWRGLGWLAASLVSTLIMISVFRTGSRSGVVTLLVVVGLVFLRVSIGGKIKMILAGALIIAVGVVASPGRVLSRLTIFSPGPGVYAVTNEEVAAIGSSLQRKELLRRSVVMTLHHPVFGVGVGMFQVADSNYSIQERLRALWHVTHNSFTQVSCETGIPGLLLYVAAMLLCFRKVRAVRKAARQFTELAALGHMAYFLNLSLIAYTISSMFASTAYEFYFPVLAALMVSFELAAQREIRACTERAQAAATPAASPAGRLRPAAVV